MFRLAVMATTVSVPVFVIAGPVFATVKAPGEHYSSLGLLNTIMLFVVTPLAIFLVVAGLAVLPSMLSERRERSSQTWEHPPIWIGSPAREPLSDSSPAPAKLPVELPAPAPLSVGALVEALLWGRAPDDSRELVAAGASHPTARGGASAEW